MVEGVKSDLEWNFPSALCSYDLGLARVLDDSLCLAGGAGVISFRGLLGVIGTYPGVSRINMP